MESLIGPLSSNFHEEDVDTFFTLFECVADKKNGPKLNAL